MEKNLYYEILQLMAKIVDAENYNDKISGVYCEDLLDLSLKNNYSYGIVYAWTHLARHCILFDTNEETDFYLKKALEINEQFHFVELQIECKNIQGIYYKSINAIYQAFSCYLEGIELAKEAQQPLYVAMFYNNLAMISLELDNYETSKKYLLEALKFTNETKEEKNISYQKEIYSNLISVAYYLDSRDDAHHYMRVIDDLLLNNNEWDKDLLCNQILIKALDNDDNSVVKLAKIFLEKIRKSDFTFYFNECCMIIGVLIKIKHKRLSRCFLQSLNPIAINGGREKLRYLKLIIEFNETFDIHDYQVYVDFYDNVEMIESVERYLLVEGVKSNIHLFTLDNDNQSLSEKRNCLEYQVNIDELTTIYNRHFFNKMMSKSVSIKNATSFACIMIDLDYFKKYNDLYGHIEGDSVLKKVGIALKMHASTNIYPCRYGGDEFACLCYSTCQSEIADYIKNVQNTINVQQILHNGNLAAPYVTLTFGSYYTESHLENDSSFYIEMSDKALYQAKEAGRNNHVKLGDVLDGYEHK